MPRKATKWVLRTHTAQQRAPSQQEAAHRYRCEPGGDKNTTNKITSKVHALRMTYVMWCGTGG